MMKKMSEYAYHYGLIVRIYPNTEQKQIISVNSDVSRFVYNKLTVVHGGLTNVYPNNYSR